MISGSQGHSCSHLKMKKPRCDPTLPWSHFWWHLCHQWLFSGMFEGFCSNQLHAALSTGIEILYYSQSDYSKAKPAFSWDSCNGESTPEKRWQSYREDKMSGKEQNPHLLTSESKDCDLVSLSSLGCGLAKLPPCACRGDEPQPHHRAPQQLSPASSVLQIICHSSGGKKNISPRGSR